MNEITLHPNIYATGSSKGLVSLLEDVWIRGKSPGSGTLYIVSGFANYNGGVRFYQPFTHHTSNGGKVLAIFGGSTSQRLTSKQVVEELLKCNVDVRIVNRKRLLHAKCYGYSSEGLNNLIVTSGNFTGPGMSSNAELSVKLDNETLHGMGYDWSQMRDNLFAQKWDWYKPDLANLGDPSWRLLYDETVMPAVLDETERVTLVITLGHADTVRINAVPGTVQSKGSQYFWLSKDSYGFFPPLTIRNSRGEKATYSAMIEIDFKDLNIVEECRVTFEAENNLDFRLGTGPLRATQIADSGDLAAIKRVSESRYELKIVREGTPCHAALKPYTVNFIGAQGKQYGFLSNEEYERVLTRCLG
jgi:hypothetical protein